MSYNKINNYPQVQTISPDMLIPIWWSKNGIQAEMSVNQLTEYIQELSGGATGIVQQRAFPNATGFTVDVENAFHVWSIIRPNAGYAAGTIVLPANPQNLQQVDFVITQSVAAITWNGNGKNIAGAPTSVSANSSFVLRYDSLTETWYGV